MTSFVDGLGDDAGLEGRTAAVTGGASDAGRACAQALFAVVDEVLLTRPVPAAGRQRR
jgi:NAD(P)-dependent dehydrogenase (short-subunit alcohol dehydrogenase family)